jgi:quercetin dioxygenase-like cupin family protein
LFRAPHGNHAASRVVRIPVTFRIVKAKQLEWEEYEQYPGRFRAALTELAGLRHTRANLIRHEPGAVGPRHAERVQDETFVPLRGTLTMYLGDPPERHDVPVGGVVHVEAGTVLQIVNETDETLVVFVCGAPPERAGADMFQTAV